jgi:peptidoglycan/LPS O-acetylase OafA/YrhL
MRTLGLGAGSYALMLASFSGEGRLAGMFSTAPLRWLGNCSYSFYLAHSLGVHVAGLLAEKVLPAASWQGAGFWLMLPVTAVLASMATLPLYLFVERPFSLRKPVFRGG